MSSTEQATDTAPSPRGPSPFWGLPLVRRPYELHTHYAEQLRLFPTWFARMWFAALCVSLAVAPFVLTDFWLSVLNFAAIASVGAIGLNILTGYTGQISLGHSFFLGVGAYTAGYLGGDLGWPMVLWLPIAGLLGAAVGVIIGPFALRLKGLYLAIVTLGLVFLGQHLFNTLRFITGGPGGKQGIPSPTIGPLDFGNLGAAFSKEQSFFYFLVPVLAVAAILAKNIVRSRPGRAFQAIRDRELAAAVLGVDLARYKVVAFGVSSFYASVAGALLGSYVGFVSPRQFDLFLSINYVAMILIGGIGTIFGSILGALFIVLVPRIVEQFSDVIPFVAQTTTDPGLSVFTLNQIIFGVLIIFFLVTEPFGMAALWTRIKLYFKSWPFSY